MNIKGELIIIGNSNWDYYYVDGTVYSIAKVEGCRDTYFGGLNHIRKLYRNGHVLGEPTERGKELLKDLFK